MASQPVPPRRRRVIIAVTLAVSLSAATAILLRPDRQPEPPPPDPPAKPTDKPSLSANPAVPLGDLRWARFNGLLLPNSPTDGPSSGTAGYTRTPRGALLAALNIAVRANARWGPRIFEPIITRQVIGQDAQQLLTRVRDSYKQQRSQTGAAAGAALGPVYAVEEGFRWHGYTPDRAALDLLTAGPGTSPGSTVRACTRVEVAWRHGDWRVIAPPNGDWGNAASPVQSTSGFTLFTAPDDPTMSTGD